MRILFGDFVVDTDRRELLRAGAAVPLPVKAYRLLELLVQRHPRVVEKDELHALLWPDAFVSEASLASLVASVRRALGERAADRVYLRTVYGVGYALRAETEVRVEGQPLPAGRCFLHCDGRTLPLLDGRNVLGRDPEATIVLDDRAVSRRHACIHVRDGTARIEDLSSRNGTWVDGERVASASPLRDGAVITVGTHRLLFGTGPPRGSTLALGVLG